MCIHTSQKVGSQAPSYNHPVPSSAGSTASNAANHPYSFADQLVVKRTTRLFSIARGGGKGLFEPQPILPTGRAVRGFPHTMSATP